jgi:hypothetical protein
MAAGQGFKTFTTGEVLTAGDVNGYLMQGVLVFASTAARDAAITSPQEGQFAFTKDTNSLFYYDGAAWVASGATGDIEGVTAGVGISGGGTSGTVTITNSMATAIDAKGDLVAGTGADTFAKLTVGANGTTLVADSSEATGLKWQAASSGAMVLITRNAFSAVSTLTIDSLFSDTYENYVMSISYSGTNGGENLYMRGRYSTTTYTGATYNNAFGGVDAADATTVVGLVSDDQAEFKINVVEQTTDVPSINNFNFFRSSGSKQLVFSGTVFDNRNERGYGGGGVIKSAQTWTGLHFFVNAGTITGTFTMYGLAKA